MAVKQDRILAILATTRRFYNDLLGIKTQIHKLTRELPPDASRDELLELVQSFQFMVDQFRPAEQDLHLLLQEEAHFKLNARRNERAAEYARRRRAGLPSSIKGLSNEQAEIVTSAGLRTSIPAEDFEAAFNKTLETFNAKEEVRQIAADRYKVPLASKSESALLATYKPLPSDTPPDPDDLF